MFVSLPIFPYIQRNTEDLADGLDHSFLTRSEIRGNGYAGLGWTSRDTREWLRYAGMSGIQSEIRGNRYAGMGMDLTRYAGIPAIPAYNTRD